MVLGSVEAGHAGVASGVNNAFSRIASLLAIASLGAIVSGAFASRLGADLAGRQLPPQARAALAAARTKPLVTSVVGVTGRPRAEIHAALVDSSVRSFRIGMGIGAELAFLGGVCALIGIEDPRREVRCAECPGGALAPATPATVAKT